MKEQPARTKQGVSRKLSDLTVHAITEYHTERITQGAQPSCIANWHIKLGLPPPYTKIPFKKIFASFGTPLSDATEERQWRKLVHRATFVRNRNPNLPSHQCRLCDGHEESILNLFSCQAAAPFWRQCLLFCKNVLGISAHQDTREAIMFGTCSITGKLLPDTARAFLRHAFNCFYHDFANVDVKEAKFHWQMTYCDAVESFRNAVHRYGMRLKILYNTRHHSTLNGIAPKEARERYPNLITIGEFGDATLTSGFKRAIVEAHTLELNYTQSHFGYTPFRRTP